jgi:integral membrane protein (TIGR01906 family)
MNRLTVIVITLLVTVALAGCLLLTSVQLAAFDMSFYERAYDRYNLLRTTGLTKRDYLNLSENILLYLNGQRDYLYNRAVIYGGNKYLFNQKELLHMEDVKNLFVRGYMIRNISFVSLILLMFASIRLSRGSKRHAGVSLFRGSIVLFVATSLSMLLLYTDFYRYFTDFHHLFFTNDLWLLNPETDLLINMYPLEFFNQMAVRIVLYFTVQLMAIASLGYFISRPEKAPLN